MSLALDPRVEQGPGEDLQVESALAALKTFFLKPKSSKGFVHRLEVVPDASPLKVSITSSTRGESSGLDKPGGPLGHNSQESAGVKRVVEVLHKWKACPVCCKAAAGSFHSRLQVRCNDPRFERELGEVVQFVRDAAREIESRDPTDLIVKEKKVPGGVDFDLSRRMSAHRLAQKLRERFYGIVKHSKKLMGRSKQTGGEVYRYYVSFRLLPVRVGDVLKLEGSFQVVAALSGTGAKLRDVSTGQVSTARLSRLIRIGRLEFVHKAGDPVPKFAFVSRQGRATEFMDVETGRLYQVEGYDGPAGPGSELEGLVLDGRLYLLEDLLGGISS